MMVIVATLQERGPAGIAWTWAASLTLLLCRADWAVNTRLLHWRPAEGDKLTLARLFATRS